MKMFALIQMQGGQPNIDPTTTPYGGFVLCDQAGSWGAYLISGTAGQLTAISALSQVVGICSVTEAGQTRWAELDGVITAAVRTKLNTWIANNKPAWPTVPAGATYRQVIRALFQRFNGKFEFESIDVAD